MMSQYFAAYYDRPNYTGDPFFNAVNPNSVKSNADTYQIRMDHRLKEKDSLWFRYTGFHDQELIPVTLKSTNLVDRPRTNFGGGDTHIFSPSVFLDVRFGYAFQPWHGITSYTNGTSPAEKAGFGGVSKFGIPGSPDAARISSLVLCHGNCSSPRRSFSELKSRMAVRCRPDRVNK